MLSLAVQPQRSHVNMFSEQLQSFHSLTLPTKTLIKQVLLWTAELTKLGCLWISVMYPHATTEISLLEPSLSSLLHLWVYSALLNPPLRHNILRFSDVCSSFKNSHVPEKLSVNETFQVSLPCCPHLFTMVVSPISFPHLMPCSSPPIPCTSPVTSLAPTNPLLFHCFGASKKQPVL